MYVQLTISYLSVSTSKEIRRAKLPLQCSVEVHLHKKKRDISIIAAKRMALRLVSLSAVNDNSSEKGTEKGQCEAAAWVIL